jgi:ELWxxDGT repeat protein
VLVKHISSTSKNFVSVGANEFFTSGDSLMISNGTGSGTKVLKTGLKKPSQLTNVNGKLYFVNNEVCNENQCVWKELWISDGTLSGTQVIKYFKAVSILNHIGNLVYLVADEYAHGLEIWKTEGTLPSTQLLKDINPGPQGSMDYFQFAGTSAIFNNSIYFAAFDPAHGRELWKSNGTISGTQLVSDLQPGPTGSDPNMFTVSGGNLFFATHNTEVPDSLRENLVYNKLWKTNGTSSGTMILKNYGPDFSQTIDHMIDINGTLFYTLDFEDELPFITAELWKSNGTSSSTVLVKKLPDNGFWYNVVNVNGTLVAATSSDFVGGSLYRSNGTASGTFIFWRTDDYNQRIDMIPLNNILYFNAVEPTGDIFESFNKNVELWQTNLTVQGTMMLKTLFPSSKLSFLGAGHFTNVNGSLYFTSNDLDTYNPDLPPTKLWKYNPGPSSNILMSMVLVNAQTDQDIRNLMDNDEIKYNPNSDQISIKVLPTGKVGSIQFVLNGTDQFVENAAPYAIRGDVDGHYHRWNPAFGSYSLTVNAYSGTFGTGTLLGTSTIHFNVVNNNSITNSEPILYPNPVNEKLSVTYSSSVAKNIQIRIIDYNGNVCFSGSYAVQEGDNVIDISAMDLKTGLYILKILNPTDEEKTLKMYKN